MILSFLHGFIFLVRKNTNSRITTTKTSKAATTGIQNESKKRGKKSQIRIKMKYCYIHQLVIKS